MIEIKDKQIHIDGQPRIITCGEIHYFRLPRQEWEDRINKLKEAGCNAVASYVPWLCHEPRKNEIDLEGETRPQLDLKGFIDLCAAHDLMFFVRPGPFIMAETKNEGIPHWVLEKHPEIVPRGWEGEKTRASDIDYLAPEFLKEVYNWYQAVMSEVIAPRLQPNGGNIIGVQLDNEIGMLSWVSNTPHLTENSLADFQEWLKSKYQGAELKNRYQFSTDEFSVFKEKVRSPGEDYAPQLHQDLGNFMRDRFVDYVDTLRSYAEEFGVKDVPFFINIHGCSGGRAKTFPIGISQLYKTFNRQGFVSGSDIYLGDITISNHQDLYLINSFIDAVNTDDQPLTSIEFNCGDGNFGNNYGGRYSPAAADFRTRMCIAQGNRMLNYYLFAGGYNYRMDQDLDDGNDRIGITGKRHGFAAPLNPEGEYNYTFPRMARVIKTISAVEDKLAVMEEENDGVFFGFIPDYYMTEYCYPGSEKMQEICNNLRQFRAGGGWEILARAMLLNNFRFGAVDLQNREINPRQNPVLVLPSAKYMDRKVQQKLATYLQQGGKLLLYGLLPTHDLEANQCRILADTLNVNPGQVKRDSHDYYLSITAENWAAPRPEIRSHYAQPVEISSPARPIFRIYDNNKVCGFETEVNQGQAIVITAGYDCDLSFFKKALKRLGAVPGLSHDCDNHGIFMTTTVTESGERFLHLLNLDDFKKQVNLFENGENLFKNQITVSKKEGVMLPLNLKIAGIEIINSTAEITGIQENKIDFRLTQKEDVITVKTGRQINPGPGYEVREKGDRIIIKSQKNAVVDDKLSVYLGE
ncbi:MAG: beta-galactosidase, partial [Bacillota bacterium]